MTLFASLTGNRSTSLLKVCLVLLVVTMADATAPATAKAFKTPLRLQDEGMFFVGGARKDTTVTYAPGAAPERGTISVGQMYVHYRVPDEVAGKPKPPIVFVHGAGLTGMSYETTPDGREGWSTYFARMGYTTYVVDLPGRGRAGFDSSEIAKEPIGRATQEMTWVAFRLGPTAGELSKGVQYPAEAIGDFMAQNVPMAEVTLTGGLSGTAPPALRALLQKIGPAILIVHSQAGPLADMLAGQDPGLIKAVVNIEGSQRIVPTDQQIGGYRDIPVLELFGDFIDLHPNNFVGAPRFDARKSVVDRINAAGGQAEIVKLPSVGIAGNTHMMMQDRNNLEVADFIASWLDRKVK